jgi:amino acid transporter
LLFAWARISVIQTGAIAAVGFVYGDYAQQLVPLGPFGAAVHAAIAILGLTLVNLLGTHPSKRAQLYFTILTFTAIFSIAVVGLASSGFSSEIRAPAASTEGAIGLALIFILLTYGGWNEAAYMSAEMRGGRRDIVKVLVLGTAAVVVLYVVVNLAYLKILGLEGLRKSDAAAADLMRNAVGPAGAVALSLVICIEALSTINASIFTGARVYHALGQDFPSFRGLGSWNQRGNTPVNGLLLQGAISMALVGLGVLTRDGFKAMVEYTAPVFWAFLLLVGIALFVLRKREPERERPFRVPLYPVVPALFCMTCGYLLYSSLVYTGLGALVGIAVLLLGTPLLFLPRSAETTSAAE